jgi:predicted Zn-dependent peptidase
VEKKGREEMSHSRLPWHIEVEGETTSVRDADRETVCDNESYYPAYVLGENMTLIVKAVNNHKRLLEAAERMVTWFQSEKPEYCEPVVAALKDAIKEAKKNG